MPRSSAEVCLPMDMQVKKLAKSEDAAVAAAAAKVVEAWKSSVKREQASTDGESLRRASSGMQTTIPARCSTKLELWASDLRHVRPVMQMAFLASFLSGSAGGEGLTVRTGSQPAERDTAEPPATPATPGSAKGGAPAASPRAFSPRGRTSGSWDACEHVSFLLSIHQFLAAVHASVNALSSLLISCASHARARTMSMTMGKHPYLDAFTPPMDVSSTGASAAHVLEEQPPVLRNRLSGNPECALRSALRLCSCSRGGIGGWASGGPGAAGG